MTGRLPVSVAAVCLCVLTAVCTISAQENNNKKWSRQVDGIDSPEADTLDWVPLAQPLDAANKDRSGNGRVLGYSQTFPPNARFGDLTKPTSTQFDFPFQFQRFSNAPQAQPLRQSASVGSPLKSGGAQEPTSQSFFKFEMPFRSEALRGGANVPPTLQTGYQIQHSFGGPGGAQATLFNSPLFNQQPVFPPEFHPFSQKPLAQPLSQVQKPLHQQNFIDDISPLKSNVFKESKPLPTQQALQSVAPQVFPVDPQPESLFDLHKPSTFQTPYQQPANAPSATTPTSLSANGNAAQQQDVQLLYVPYDTLFNQQQQQQSPSSERLPNNYDINKYNVNGGLPAVNPYQINQFYTQDPISNGDFFTTSTTSRPRTTLKSQNVFQNFAAPPQTTVKPKPKAHQPPLAMFLLRSTSRPTQSDVVAALRNANSISVIDAPTKQTPEIFVGPAGMPIPDGYVKFDLPYLSQLVNTRDLRDVSFFVAPLSYRTPNGFNKILLPEPHVGSIVINRAKDSNSQQEIVQYQPTTQRTRPAATTSTRNPFEVTTQRVTGQPGRGNKFSYYYVQDPIQEVTSPKITKQERPKKKRPQTVQIEQPTYQPQAQNPFDQFNQIGNDDFFASLRHKPTTSTSSTSTSTTSTTSTSTTTSTTPPPQTLFTYSTSPQVEFQSTNGQLYHDFNLAAKQPAEEHAPRFTTRPPAETSTDEEYRMKQYFRQQDAFRNRPHAVNPTNPPFEQVQYTPVSVDYEREVNMPTTTQKATTKGKQRVTIYTPGTVPVTTSDVGYNTVSQQNNQLPGNHRPSYNQNEIPDGNIEYEPNPYHVPSELPPLTPDIPGLVNNLQDKQLTTTTPAYETDPATRPTRRPLLRTRKPVVSKVTSSVSYSESENTGKQSNHRVRRPYGSRGSSSSLSDDELASTTTRRPTGRNPLIRNPNRIRYQPTTEERQSLKIKKNKNYHGSKKEKEAEDLEYQRDVLKQNYPVIKPARKPTSPTAIPSSYDFANSEGPTSETQQVYTVTPSNSIDSGDTGFPAGLLEPMQIAQHYNEFSKDNYGPGYFPNQEDLNPTEPILRNEINPVYTTLATTTPSTTTTTTTTVRTTTEAPQTTTTTTRRSPFIRRNYPRLRTTTTTEAPTTTPAEELRPSIRARLPPRRVVKVRTRTRRPLHPASSTNAPEEVVEQVTQKQNLRKLSRFNQELYENDPPRRRYKQPFQLEGQESQWSPAIKSGNSNSDSFKPLNTKETSTQHFDNEQEIVTAAPSGEDSTQQPETYEFKVAANLGSNNQRTTLKAPNLKPEKSFAELLEEVMGKAPGELTTNAPTDVPHTVDYVEQQKTTIAARLNRRGKWKKTRVSNAQSNENFETAESQNIGSQLYNSLYSNEKATEKSEATSTTTTTESALLATTTATPSYSADEYDLTTLKSLDYSTISATLPMNLQESATEESATRRMDVEDDMLASSSSDDLDTQPSLFSEVKKQLHDLFAIEESDDTAVTAALAAVGKRRQEYMNIKRTKPITTTEGTTPATTDATPTTVATTIGTPAQSEANKENFHKDLMEHVVYATSTSSKITSETEICYRGRCIRSEDLPANHKLH